MSINNLKLFIMIFIVLI